MSIPYARILIIFTLLGIPNAFSQNEIATTVPSFEEYSKNAKAQCESPKTLWHEFNSLQPIPRYAPLQAQSVNKNAESIKTLTSLSDDEKKRLEGELAAERLGSYDGFKTLEVARLQYRSTMDNIFACAIVESRLHIIKDVQNRVNAVFPSLQSEIQEQLGRESERLSAHKSKLRCNSIGDQSKASFIKELVNSSSKQYCHYRHYLSYLESNLKTNQHAIIEMEKNIGKNNTTTQPSTMSEWVNINNRYTRDLEREIDRADSSLIRAMQAYKEMEKAYGAHLLLTIIYDDYIRLRKNLASYMNASTQLYMKANNAQDTNQ